MTARDRPAPENGPSSAKPCVAPGSLLPPIASASMWEQWYRAASPAQREQLLEQSRQQGILFAQQLPPAEGGVDLSSCAARLSELLSGRPAAHAGTEPFTPFDSDLDDCQRLAVARALSTPDVALVMGYPGSGKSRVVVELLRQTIRRSLRVLFVAPDSAALDCVLERLTGESALAVLRWHAEQDAVPSSCAARLTLASRIRAIRDQALPAARKASADAGREVDRLRGLTAQWARLETLLEEMEVVRRESQSLAADREAMEAGLAAEVETLDEWTSFVREDQLAQAGIETRLAAVDLDLERLAVDQRHCDDERSHLAPLVEAKQGHRWWTGAFWRATLQGSPQPRLEELACRCAQIADQLESLQREKAELVTQVEESRARRDRKRRQVLESHGQKRRGSIDARSATLVARQTQMLADWHASGVEVEQNRAALESARVAATQHAEAAEAALQQRQAWQTTLEQALPGLPADLVSGARVIAATTGGLPREGFPGGGLTEFDLVVVEEAHRVSEAELLGLARRTCRIVLVGEAPTDLPIAPPPKKSDRPRPVLLPMPFVRLWESLHPDPRRLPARCRQVHGRLVLTLRALLPEQQPWLQREPVFDRPEIEVGIVSAPGQDPCIAEVVFPGSTTIAEAKEFVYRELQELSPHPAGTTLQWRERGAGPACELGPPEENETAVQLGDGLSEHVARCHCSINTGEVIWQTTRLEFDAAAGWDRPAAERWVEERLGLRDSGRTAFLGRCYRSRGALARFVSRLVFNGACSIARESAGSPGLPSVQFVPVPTAAKGEGRRVADPEPRWGGGGTATLAPRMRTARGGAGLEVDLVDPRRPDALPLELRPLLPSRGVVNYLEAVAVVQALEELVSNSTFRSTCADWQQNPGDCLQAGCCDPHPVRSPAVAVLSVFPSQVALLRVLVQRSATVSASGVTVDVCQPQAMAQRECLAALVSLTRSHATRAVPFSDHPRDLLLALTRAAGRLVLFGDPGTMSRRSQWFGALDHLDESTGPVEQALIGQLLAHTPEQEAVTRSGRTLESSSV